MNKYKVLISAPYLQREFEKYKDRFIANGIDCVLPQVAERLEESELLEIIAGFDGVICGDDRFTKAVIDRAGKLKVIVKWGTGIDSIDKTYARSKGIPVYNTPGAFSEPVSDTVMACMLAFSRRMLDSDRLMKSGGWDKPSGRTLSETTLGIVGVGDVGRAVARKANAFGMKIYGNDIVEIPGEVTQAFNIEMVSFEQLLQKADVVSLNCDLNPTSFHLMEKNAFAMMQKSAYLVNMARGPVVKEDALIEALQKHEIAGAALDVFEVEPLPRSSPLRDMSNVILSSHNSNSSPKYWRLVHEKSISYLLDVLR